MSNKSVVLNFLYYNIKHTKKVKKLFEKLKKFPLNAHDIWKLLALILMIVDHIGFYVLDDNPYFRIVGRLAFPIFAIIYGFHFKGKLNFSLIIYGLFLMLVEYCTFRYIFFNVLYSLFLATALINLYNKIPNKYHILFILISVVLNFFIVKYIEYGMFAFFFMLAAQQKEKYDKILAFTMVFMLYYILQSLAFSFNFQNMGILFVILFIEAILLYNYKNKSIQLNNFIMENTIKFIARYTLQLYVLQGILFQIYYYYKLK